MLILKILSCVSFGMLAVGAWGANPEVRPAAWKLVWADEFNKSGLPDPAKWVYEEGFARNEEPQYYMSADKDNTYIGGGVLTIEARKEVVPNPKYDPTSTKWKFSRKQAEYSSASLITKGKASWTYGRFEMRAKLPYGSGTWPAFWTLGENVSKVGWPACGEVDIMEYIGCQPNTTTANIHFKKGGKHMSRQGKLAVQKPWGSFHIYAMEWFPDRMDFYYDNKKFHTVKLDQLDDADADAFHKPHYLLLCLAIGQYGGPIDESTLPQRLVVDYIRVYQQSNGTPRSPSELKPTSPHNQ